MAKKGSLTTAEIEGRSLTFSWNGVVSGSSTVISYSLVSSGSYAGGVSVRYVSLTANGKSLFSTSNYEAIHTAPRNCTYTPAGETLKTGSFTVNHDSNGKATLSVTLTASIYDGVQRTVSKSFTLDDTVSASYLALPPFTLGGSGSPITIYQGKDKTTLLSNLGHKLKYKIGNMTDWVEVVSKGGANTFSYTALQTGTYPNATSFLFDPPASDYQYIVDGALTGKMILTTYSDKACTKYVGENSINMRITISDSFKPTIGTVTLTPDNSEFDSIDTSGLVLSNLTNIVPVFTTTAYSGSTIKKITVTDTNNSSVVLNDGSYAYTTQTVNTINFASRVGFSVPTSGEHTFNITVTDSKGVSNTVQTESINALGYDKPIVDYFIANRRGSTSNVVIACNILFASIKDGNVEKNGIDNIKLYYKESGMPSTAYVEYTGITIENTVPIEVLNFNNLKKYDLKIVATDLFGGTVESTQIVPKAEIYLHKPSGGKGLGIGTNITEEDKLKSKKIIKIGNDWDVELQGMFYGVRDSLNPKIYHHKFTIDTAEKAAIGWRDVVTDYPNWQIPDGVYKVTFTVTVEGTSGSAVGLLECLWCNGTTSSATEYSKSDCRTRGTAPMMNGVTQTINVTWYFNTTAYGNTFTGKPQVFGSLKFKATKSAIWIERVADDYTVF